jgi:predicted permease
MLHRLTSELRFRLRALLRRGDMERELDDELRFHLERDIETRVASGVPRAEAERLAWAAFGGMERIKDDARDSRGVALLEQTLQDLRHALRTLGTHRVFAAGIVLTLALGIGVNATMFGIVDRLLFRAPPGLRDPATVHRVYRLSTEQGEERVDRNLAFPTYLDVRRFTHTLSDVAAFQTRQLAVGDGEAARLLTVTVASASYFAFFGAQPAQGRWFSAADDSVPLGAPVAVLGYAYWQAQFGGRNVIGEHLRVDRTVYTIVGVAPRGFVGMTDQGVPAIYLPITQYASAFRGPAYVGNYNWSWLEIIARRRSGIRRELAGADVGVALHRSWGEAQAFEPGWGSPDSARVRGVLGPVQLQRGPEAGREAKVAVWTAGVALIVLLIACANVTNLLLSRAVSRRREMAMRVALGAGRGRLVRQLLTESGLLAVLGGLLGLALAQWGGALLRASFLGDAPWSPTFTDARTLVFTAAATLAAALLTGLMPALHATRHDLATSLKTGGREGGYERARTRTVLLVFQPALSVVLLVGAGLFVRSLGNVRGFRLGYDVEPVVYAIANSRGEHLDHGQVAALNDRMLAAAQALPGVTHATQAASVPFWSNEGRGLYLPGTGEVKGLGHFVLQVGSPDYFRTLGTRILGGRAFDATDRVGSPLVAVVSSGMARALWPGREPLGQCFRIDSERAACTTVIGVAEDMRVRTLTDEREYTYYLPVAQYQGELDPQLFARVNGRAPDYVNALRRRLQALMPGAAYVNVVPLEDLVDPTMQSWRFGAIMFAAFGGLALVLAAVGLYSVIAYDVAQRTRDLGVRVALGASVSRIVGWVLARSMRLVAAGLVLGGAVALWATPHLGALLFHESPRDPVVFGSVAAALLAVGIVAAVAPAIRAARVEPNVVLRGD